MSDPIDRACALLSRPDAWLEADGAVYRLRLAADRRRRPALTLDEAEFRALAEEPGLAIRAEGGWAARRGCIPAPAPEPPGRPGHVEGRRTVATPEGRLETRRANLGTSPIAWLARRTDASGAPFLSPVQIAAGERLSRDAEMAMRGASVTMRWDALPRAGAGGGGDATPGDRALAAARRVAEALDACGPRLAPTVAAICVQGSSLTLAERDHGLRRREGKTVLKGGLDRLAAHYRIG